MSLTPTEQKMWDETPTKTEISNGRVREKYPTGEPKILLEVSWRQLPSLVASLKESSFIDLQPFYLRRKPWNRQKQSREHLNFE